MSMKHSLTAMALCIALSPAAEALANSCSQDHHHQFKVEVDNGERTVNGFLDIQSAVVKGGFDPQLLGKPGSSMTDAFVDHVKRAISFADVMDREVGFGFYGKRNPSVDDDGKYHLGRIWAADTETYQHHRHFMECDTQWLEGGLSEWQYQGDLHVHKKSSNTSEVVYEKKGNPSLRDLVGRNWNGTVNADLGGYMFDDVTRTMMTVASKRSLAGGYDASILHRQQESLQPLEPSKRHRTKVNRAKERGRPETHNGAIDIIRGAFQKADLKYFSGRFNFKENKRSFKERKIW